MPTADSVKAMLLALLFGTHLVSSHSTIQLWAAAGHSSLRFTCNMLLASAKHAKEQAHPAPV